jgi:hypothetical protein
MLSIPTFRQEPQTVLIAPEGSDPPSGDEACLYTVSIDLMGMRDDLLFAGYHWARGHFRSVTCLLGDGPLIERTARVTGTSLEEAAKRVGDLRAKFETVCLVSELSCTTDFAAALADVRQARLAHPRLARAVRADARTYVTRVRRREALAIAPSEAMTLSVEYIEIELASYLCLARQGLLVDVYVGEELPVLKKFIVGKFQGILPPLERRIFLGLLPCKDS